MIASRLNMKPSQIKILMLVATNIATLTFAGSAPAQIIAYDDAAAYYKTSNWTNGANQGFGFTPWVLATNHLAAAATRGWYLNNGYAIASATNIGGTAYTNCSWGIYANGTAPAGGNRTVAYRGFASSLTTNVTFKLQWMSEGIGSGGDEFWRICSAQRELNRRRRFV